MQEIMRSLWSPYGRHSHFCKFRLEDGQKCSYSSSSLFLIPYPNDPMEDIAIYVNSGWNGGKMCQFQLYLWKTLTFMWIPAGKWETFIVFQLDPMEDNCLPFKSSWKMRKMLEFRMDSMKDICVPLKSGMKMGKMLEFRLDPLWKT